MGAAIVAAGLAGIIAGAVKTARWVTKRQQHARAMTRLYAPLIHVRTIEREGEEWKRARGVVDLHGEPSESVIRRLRGGGDGA
jgi:hypothetical protein